MELVVPEKKEELKADLEKRLGVKIIKVEVGAVDFIRDMAMLRIVYEGLQTPANAKLKLKNSDLTDFYSEGSFHGALDPADFNFNDDDDYE